MVGLLKTQDIPSLTFGVICNSTTAMELVNIRDFTNKHCRFKLRSGKEVFGVVWEVESTDHSGNGQDIKRLFFASISDYERLLHYGKPVHLIPLQPDEIVWAESLAAS